MALSPVTGGARESFGIFYDTLPPLFKGRWLNEVRAEGLK